MQCPIFEDDRSATYTEINELHNGSLVGILDRSQELFYILMVKRPDNCLLR